MIKKKIITYKAILNVFKHTNFIDKIIIEVIIELNTSYNFFYIFYATTIAIDNNLSF